MEKKLIFDIVTRTILADLCKAICPLFYKQGYNKLNGKYRHCFCLFFNGSFSKFKN